MWWVDSGKQLPVWEERTWTLGDAMCAGDVQCAGILAVASADWTVDLQNGRDARSPGVRSGAIGAAADEGGRTNTTLTATVDGAGSGSFWWKVSCEEMDEEYGEWYDYAVFTVDGVEVAKIAGDSGWRLVEYTVAGAGAHTLAWTFTRDDYDEDGAGWQNAAWVDDVVWTPVPKELTLGDVASADAASAALPWTTGGDTSWTMDATTGYADGDSAKSGAVESGQSSWIEVSVSGAGTVTFRWNVMGGAYRGTPFAFAKVEVDGTLEAQEHVTDGWKEQTVEVAGTGPHTIRWTYLRTNSRPADGDCAWLDAVAWTPSGSAGIVVDAGGGKTVTVPAEWIAAYPALVSAAGGDAEAAVRNGTAANGRKVWECYVVGLDPQSMDEFKISAFPMKADGTPDLENIAVDPPQAQWNVPGARAVVYGAATLAGEWKAVEGATAAEKAAMRFFKVVVVVP